MLKEASDYTYVDVSNIVVAGKFMPARDMGGSGTWRALHAEDIAYLLEMAAERGRQIGVYAPGFPIVYQLDTVRLAVASLVPFVVDADYEFETRIDNVSDSPASVSFEDWYPGARNFVSALIPVETSYWHNGVLVKPGIGADCVRRAFYDLMRMTRFYGVITPYHEFSYTEVSHEAKIFTDENGKSREIIVTATSDHTDVVHNPLVVYWEAFLWDGENGESGCYFNSERTNTSIGGFEIDDFSVITGVTDNISGVVAFMHVWIWYKDGENGMVYHTAMVPVDLEPVEQEEEESASDTWRLPDDFNIRGVVEELLSDLDIPISPPPVTGVEAPGSLTKSMEVRAYASFVCVAVKHDFPSDFSELGWGWTPGQNANP